MVINYQATVDKGLSHLKEGSALGEVREEEIKIAERSRTALHHQVDQVSVAIAREGEELVSLQDQLRKKMEESKARRAEEEVRDFLYAKFTQLLYVQGGHQPAEATSAVRGHLAHTSYVLLASF